MSDSTTSPGEKPMTPAEFEHIMKLLAEYKDTEIFHLYADEIMCDLLSSLGYKSGIDIFVNKEKWYA